MARTAREVGVGTSTVQRIAREPVRPPPPPAPPSPDAALRAELAQAQATIQKLRTEVAALRKPAAPLDETVERLRKANAKLRRERKAVMESPKFRAVFLTRETVREIRAALHPRYGAIGNPAKQARLERAAAEFNGLTILHATSPRHARLSRAQRAIRERKLNPNRREFGADARD
jgi:hypothetical protein